MKLADVIETLSEKIMSYKMQELQRINSVNVNFNLFQYIYAMNGLENPTFSDLAEKLNVSKPAVTVIVNKMIQQGIAYKHQSETDKRIFYINLTEKGREIADTCKSAHVKLEEYMREKLTGEEYQQLLNLLYKTI
jgi:DNA-binding MarR family transcriptional regulator